MPVSQEKLLEKFCDYSLTTARMDDVYQMIEICTEYNLSEQALLDKFETFLLNHNLFGDVKIDKSLISRFRLEGLKKVKRGAYMPKPNIMANITGVAKVKKEILASPVAFQSPASETFAKRTQKGKVVAQVGEELIQFATDEAQMKIVGHQGEQYNYMGQKPIEMADAMYAYIEKGIKRVRSELGVDEEADITSTTQETVTLVGMILIDNGDAFLYNQDGEVKLDLEETETYSLYSGMFCAVRGVNPTGDAFAVDAITSISNSKVKQEPVQQIQNTTVLVAAGPYFTSDSVSNDPINELVTQVKEHKPNLTVLIGPFLDENHHAVQSGEIGGREIISLLKEKIEHIEGSGSKCLLISSQRDILAEPVYPTPKYSSATVFGVADNLANIPTHMSGDPTFLELNGWKVALTSNDVLLHITRALKTKNTQGEKMTRAALGLMASRTIQPIQPPPLGVNVDCHKLDRLSFPEGFVPDAIITPSVLQPTIKPCNEENSVLMNPGFLTKGKGGGSYGLIQFNTNGHRARIIKI